MGDESKVNGSPFLTTKEAAEYCRFTSAHGLYSAAKRGKVKPYGRRGGGRGAMLWTVTELDRFLRGDGQASEHINRALADGPKEADNPASVAPREPFRGAGGARSPARRAEVEEERKRTVEAAMERMRDIARRGKAACR